MKNKDEKYWKIEEGELRVIQMQMKNDIDEMFH